MQWPPPFTLAGSLRAKRPAACGSLTGGKTPGRVPDPPSKTSLRWKAMGRPRHTRRSVPILIVGALRTLEIADTLPATTRYGSSRCDATRISAAVVLLDRRARPSNAKVMINRTSKCADSGMLQIDWCPLFNLPKKKTAQGRPTRGGSSIEQGPVDQSRTSLICPLTRAAAA